MKIGFYISGITASDGGIYQYSIYVLKMLLQCDVIEKVYVFHSSDQLSTFGPLLNHPRVVRVIYEKNSKLYFYRKRTSDFFLTRYYLKLNNSGFFFKLYSLLNPDRSFLNKFKLDVLHVPRQLSPSYNLNYPVVVSMHDLQQLHYPEFFTPLERIYRAISYYIAANEADHIIVSYNHVKDDIKKFFRDIATDVSVCTVPVNEDWLESKETSDISELRTRFNLPDKFMLTPAATWEHKNHLAVLEALSILKKQGEKIFWVSTGKKMPFYKTIEKKITELGLNDQVIFTDVVSDADLLGLYKMAHLVVIPTLYEAGSGPLFEAMRYQVPVICSNVTSLPDTINNDEFIFEPLDYQGIALMIQKAFSDQEFRERNKKNSVKQITNLKNSDYSIAFIKAYQKAAEFHKTRPQKV